MIADYDKYEEEGKGFSGHDEYATSRKKKRKLPFCELQTGQCVLSTRDKFCVNTFLGIIDTLKSELEKRAAAYTSFFGLLSFFENLQELSREEIKKAALKLMQNYDIDIEESILVEAIHLRAWASAGGGKRRHLPPPWKTKKVEKIK